MAAAATATRTEEEQCKYEALKEAAAKQWPGTDWLINQLKLEQGTFITYLNGKVQRKVRIVGECTIARDLNTTKSGGVSFDFTVSVFAPESRINVAVFDAAIEGLNRMHELCMAEMPDARELIARMPLLDLSNGGKCIRVTFDAMKAPANATDEQQLDRRIKTKIQLDGRLLDHITRKDLAQRLIGSRYKITVNADVTSFKGESSFSHKLHARDVSLVTIGPCGSSDEGLDDIAALEE
jgi:hypothetical protein